MISGRLPVRAAGRSKGAVPSSEGQAQQPAVDRAHSVHGDDLAPEAHASPWGPLAIRDYRLHLLGGLAFSGSLWVVFPAVGWIALELTGAPSKVTLANVVWFSSYFFLALPAGVAADLLASVLSGSAAWVYVALLPVMTRDVLGGDAFLFGVLSTAIGVGQIPAALGLALYRDYRWPGRSYVAAVILLGVAISGFANSTSVPLSIVLLAVTGFAFSSQFILLNGMLLRLVEPEYHGRVMGALNITWGANVVGLLAGGAVVDVLGVSVVVAISGGAVAASALLIVAMRPQLLRL